MNISHNYLNDLIRWSSGTCKFAAFFFSFLLSLGVLNFSIFKFQFGRWSFLTAGILYGAFHQNRLSKKEVKIREIEAKEKVIKDAKLKEEKAIAAAGG